MKKILSLFVALLSVILLKAQTIANEQAMQLVTKNSSLLNLSPSDLANTIISDAYVSNNAGTEMVYIQQAYKSIPVYNQIRVVAFKNGVPVSQSGSFIESLDKKINAPSGIPQVAAADAVIAALADRKLNPASAVTGSLSADGKQYEFGDLGVSRENITARLAWVPSTTSNRVYLAWQVYIIPVNSDDYWMVRVDASNRTILGMDNYTVYCNWDEPANTHFFHRHNDDRNNTPVLFDFISSRQGMTTPSLVNSPSIVNGASYRVVPFPAESPIHPGGTPVLVSDPWNLAPGNATTLKWHFNGTTNFSITRGNNVIAQEDRNNNNGTGASPTSTTPDPLTFDFTPNFSVVATQTTPVQNQQFNTTNLFYWNNIIHDITYQYGFDEASGNFQDNNQGRGGLGSDHVNADAQDGGGTNNANFSTPPDGSNPRMQMYLWSGSPQKDGDVDNGVVTHEYAHGISNRLTGGPSQAGCLTNAEQMGEGWSDYYGLMYTQNWATATLTTGFTTPRGVGAYVSGQGPNGSGIRNQKYCTNFTVNNRVYGNVIPAESHDRGEIWCATLWDMTWNIIEQVGTINPNIFDATGGGGNTIALRLVTEGMKLQPCSPGFIDGRDAILRADQLLYGGAYNCAIREAFRRRGMGAFASQGSSSSISDQRADFTAGGATLTLTQNGMTQVPEGGLITYNNVITTTPCAPLSDFILTDTLPSNVTYVSGGNYNATTRVVSFPVNQAAGVAQNYTFTVLVNAGAYFPTVNLFEDNVAGPGIPATWTTNSTTSVNWIVSNERSHSAPNSYFSFNQDVTSDQKLTLTNSLALGATPPPLLFWHWYSAESGYDGGVLEISTNNGSTWTDVEPNIVSGGYTGVMDNTTLISGRRAWTGSTNNNFIRTKVNLTPYANQNVKFRFRFITDVGTNLDGWYIDDIAVKSQAVVEMKTTMFTSVGVRVATSDTITIITAPVSCANVAIANQPANLNACAGNDAVFSITATGDNPVYQWQVSTNNGTTYMNIPGATTATLTLTNVTAAQNGNLYQVLLSNTCPSNLSSAAALLTVGSPASLTAQPTSQTVCAGNAANFTVGATGSANTYQWQVSTDGGNTFTDIAGATSATLNLPSATATLNNNQYHVIIGSCNPTAITSANVTLTVNSAPAIVAQPVNLTVCDGTNAVFTVDAAGTNINYQWQLSTDGGVTFTPVTGANTNTITIPAVTAALNNHIYNVIISGTCPAPVTSANATLTVSNTASITNQPIDVIACVGSTASFAATASGTAYQWQVSTDNGVTFTDIPGATSTVLDIVNVTASMNGNQYRLLVSSCSPTGLTSTAAVLTVNDPATIVTQPDNAVVCPGGTATFTVTASGTAVTYQWEVSTDGGVSFNPIAGETNPTLVVPNVTAAMANNLYRVVLNNSCTVNFTSNSASLNLTSAAVIDISPVSVSGCSGSTAAFSVSATGTGITYQWQVSTDGGATFTNISGETSVSLNLSALTTSMNNNQYRVLVLNPCLSTPVESDAATLTVNPLPVVVISASPSTSLTSGTSTTLTASSTPPSSTFNWYRDANLIAGSNGTSITVSYGEAGIYTASSTDGNNCTAVSNALLISDSTVSFSFIYPNPNTGNFQVRYSGIHSTNLQRYITMYDAKGARVFSKSYVVAGIYDEMDVHAERLSTGVYALILTDGAGNILGKGNVVIRF